MTQDSAIEAIKYPITQKDKIMSSIRSGANWEGDGSAAEGHAREPLTSKSRGITKTVALSNRHG